MRTCSVTSWAYIAGFFDGEGCVTSSPATLCVVVRMNQKTPQVLREIQKVTGGRVRYRPGGGGSWALTIQGKALTTRFIQEVLPYSIVKATQLVVALRMVGLQVERYSSNRKARNRRERLHLHNELKELKHGTTT